MFAEAQQTAAFECRPTEGTGHFSCILLMENPTNFDGTHCTRKEVGQYDVSSRSCKFDLLNTFSIRSWT